MSTLEQAVFKSMKDDHDADATLKAKTNPNGFIRLEDKLRSKSSERIEFEFVEQEDMDSNASGVVSALSSSHPRGIARLWVTVPEGRAFGTGDTPEAAGNIDSIVGDANDSSGSIRGLFDNVTLTTVGSFAFSKFTRGRVITPTNRRSGDTVRIVEYDVVATELES